MAALHQEWQAARIARQDEIAQRHEAIRTLLDHHHQIRNQGTAELQQMLAEHYASIQDETSLYLAQVGQQRQAQAEQTAQTLQAFDAELQATVASMREDNRRQMQDIAASVDDLCLATQETIAGHQRDRLVKRSLQQQELGEYAAELEDSVADYLDELTENRQAKAVVDQAQRHRDREALADEVHAMRDDFAIHRQQMRAFREQLRQSVWGEAVPARRSVTSKTAKARPTTTPAKSAAMPKSTKSSMATTPSPKATTTQRRSRAKTKSASAQAQQPNPTNATISKTSAKSNVPNEEAVFDYLQTHSEGARLTEIESTLGINRFQAVDALRSLIQKELIVQKDRTYRIQEEAVL